MIKKILWICNKVPTTIANQFNIVTSPLGGWLDSMPMSFIKDGYQLGVICPYHMYYEKKIEGILLRSFYEKDSCHNIKRIIRETIIDEKPDVIHIWGTEFKHSCYALEVAEELGLLNKCVVSIQGLVSFIGRYHFDVGVPMLVKYGLSIHDLIKQKLSVNYQKQEFIRRGYYEIKALQKAKHIIGRTDWDKSVTELVNPNALYHIGNETLRDTFYSFQWDINNIERHSIFVSQSNYPLKGFHYMIQAMPYILKIFPDAILYTTGLDLVKMSFHERMRVSYYQLYLRKLIRKMGLQKNIKFLGVLNEMQMREQYLKTNVFVSPSTIENSSNSIAEAMLMGCPIVASNVGGTKSVLQDGVEGYLYPCNEPYMLAAYVIKLFKSDEICLSFSKASRKHAQLVHNRELNYKTIVSIYEEISDENH